MTGVDAESLRGFLDGLRPQLELARKVESELDRRMARRFNVLDYIRTSELGLSKIIADLLNPSAAHGQGVLFLDLLLRGLKASSERGKRDLGLTKNYGDWVIEAKNVLVETEHTIPKGSLDVWVKIGVGDDVRCLAFENKPYARDSAGQVKKYLDHLEKKYGDGQDGVARHCLIYLPGSGEMPAQWSMDDERKEKEKRERHFAVMPYCRTAPSSDAESEGDDDAAFLLDYTLADWFRDCRRTCDVDRLRWFLGDAESFCERRFGGSAMMDSTEDQLDEILMQRLDVVGEVVKRWPGVRAEVLKRFGDRLKVRIEKKLGPDVSCEHTLSDPALRRYDTGISVYRTSWKLEGQSVAIRAEAAKAGATDWIIGVGTLALTDAGKPGRQEIYESLQTQLVDAKVLGPPDRITELWPWIKLVDDPWKQWDVNTVLELAREGGDAENYFVGRFLDIFKKARPEIDAAVEAVWRQDAGQQPKSWRFWRPT